jgi:hypothetical protein
MTSNRHYFPGGLMLRNLKAAKAATITMVTTVTDLSPRSIIR